MNVHKATHGEPTGRFTAVAGSRILGAQPAGLEDRPQADGWLPFGVDLVDIGRVGSTSWTQPSVMGETSPAQCGTSRPEDRRVHSRAEREPFTGSCGQVMSDIERLRDIGVTELILDFHATASSADELVDCAVALAESTLAAA